MERCFVCGARDWASSDGAAATCGHCGVKVHAEYRHGRCKDELRAVLKPGPLHLAATARTFSADAYTMRIAATASRLSTLPGSLRDAAALAYPHGPDAAHLILRPFAPAPRRVALGMIVRPDGLEPLLKRIEGWRSAFAETVIAVDAPAAPQVRSPGVRWIARRLSGDFAAQRNSVQDAARAPWVLQLDDDEVPSEGLLATMDALTAIADVQHVASIGFARRNLVDGRLSDLYPDIQYRLNRRGVRFRGAVHERPAVAGGWRRTTIALCGHIDHHLEGERIRSRSRAYEAIARGGGRPGDEAALLRPFAA